MNRLKIVIMIWGMSAAVFCRLEAQSGAPGTVRLSANGFSVAIDTARGGRVVSLMLAGAEQLSGPSVHPKFYGSSLWLSPENKWKGNGLLDEGPYSTLAVSKNALSLESGRDTVRGFQMRKEFILHGEDSSVEINYIIRNLSADTQWVAPWEVTRVPTGGLAFFPSGDSVLLAKSNLPVTSSGAVTWYPYDTSTGKSEKLFSRGAEGWTAYSRNGFVFIKTYPVFGRGPWPAGKADRRGKNRATAAGIKPGQPKSPAPGEENVEIYVNKPKTYMELENQGPYRMLAAGTGFLQYNTRWYVRKLPAGTDTAVGSNSLLKLVRRVIGD